MKKKDIDLDIVLRPIPPERMHELTKQELIVLLRGEQRLRAFFEEKAHQQEALAEELKEQVMVVEDTLVKIKHLFFGKSSERNKRQRNNNRCELEKEKKEKAPVKRILSDRYPNAPIIEKDVDFVHPPLCHCCNSQMSDSGMTEDSEYLTVIPKQYIIVRQKRRKYRCEKCHGTIETAPTLPRIRQGSSYSDDMMIDVALSKYCDLLPIERYAQMAARQGFSGLPPHSLIESSHYVAAFAKKVYSLLRAEICGEEVIMADETPHRMLEGSDRSNWYLWGFSSEKTCYFECHDTRAGAVATNVLIEAACVVLMSDVYTGYGRAVKDSNVVRAKQGRPLIKNAYCNAHARRRFKDAERRTPESKVYVDKYSEIYKLYREFKRTSDPSYRKMIEEIFISIKECAVKDVNRYSSKSEMGMALNYFIKNYDGLTIFINNPNVPIDNNAQERLLRSSVIGRKTWSSRSRRLPSSTSHRTGRDSLPSSGSCQIKYSSVQTNVVSIFSICSKSIGPFHSTSSSF